MRVWDLAIFELVVFMEIVLHGNRRPFFRRECGFFCGDCGSQAFLDRLFFENKSIILYHMNRIIASIVVLVASSVLVPSVYAEGQERPAAAPVQKGELHTIVGLVGDGTAMHTLCLEMPDGKILWFGIDDDTEKDLKDGLLVGRKIAVTYRDPDEDDDSPCITAVRIADA